MAALLAGLLAIAVPAPARGQAAALPVRPDAQAQAQARPETLIRDLYRARDGKGPEPDPTRWTEPEVARRLFVPRLAALAVEDGRRAVPDRRIGFDPFTGATGVATRNPLIRVVSQTGTRADVEARFPADPAGRGATFRLVPGPDGWRIADIWWGGDRTRSLARLVR